MRLGAWDNLLAADSLEREKNMKYTVQALKLADRLQAACCVNITGSLSDIWDGPHPDNLTEKTFRQVRDTICRLWPSIWRRKKSMNGRRTIFGNRRRTLIFLWSVPIRRKREQNEIFFMY